MFSILTLVRWKHMVWCWKWELRCESWQQQLTYKACEMSCFFLRLAAYSWFQSFSQTESELRQEINDLVKWKAMVDGENAFLRKEFSDLQKKCKDKSQELKVCWLVHAFTVPLLWCPPWSLLTFVARKVTGLQENCLRPCCTTQFSQMQKLW